MDSFIEFDCPDILTFHHCFSGDARKSIFTIDEQAITLLKTVENVVAC